METLIENIQELILPVKMVENVPLQMFLTVTGTDVPAVTIKHTQVQEVWLEQLDTVSVLLVAPPALDTGVTYHRDINAGHNVSCP